MNPESDVDRSGVNIVETFQAHDGPLVQGSVGVLCSGALSRRELQIVQADLFLIRSADEFRSATSASLHSFLILPSGIDLTRELLLSGAFQNDVTLIWAFGQPVLESLLTLDTMGLSQGTSIFGFAGMNDDSLLMTRRSNDAVLDRGSFEAGLRTARTETTKPSMALHGGEELSSAELRDLRFKHLNLLKTLGPTLPSKSADIDDSEKPREPLKLENDLILLKRRYDALDRKYTALANSRLGRVTLKLWDRKRRGLLASQKPRN